MADSRINALATTASSTASDDFLVVDGTTNGTRKLNAYSPSFGGNATVTGTLTVNGTSTFNNTLTVSSNVGFIGKSGSGTGGNWRYISDDGTSRWLSGILGTPSETAFDIYDIVNGRSLLTLTAAGVVKVPQTTASTSTSTGALVVSGGVGVAGAIHSGNNIRATGNLYAGDSSVSTGAVSIQVGDTRTGSGYAHLDLIGDTTYSDYGLRLIRGNGGANATSGLTHRGTGELHIATEEAASILLRTANTTALTITSAQQVQVNATTASTSTSTGALVVSGGVGVAGAGYFGSTVDVSGSGAIGLKFTTSNNDAQVRLISTAAGGRSYSIGSGATAAGAGNGFYIYDETGVALALLIDSNRQVQVKATTASTSTSSGALVVSGGVGVAKELYIGGLIESSDAAGIRVRTASGTAAKLSVIQTGNATWEMQSIASSSDFAITANSTTDAFRVTTAGNATLAGSVKTSAPSGGTAAAWKLGTVATVSPTSPNRTIEVDIGGTIYYIHAKTTNN